MIPLKLAIALALSAAALVGCASPDSDESATDRELTEVISQCEDPRPELCSSIYDPVCATRVSTTECATTPCPTTEEITYSSACTACQDNRVVEHRRGACE